MKLANTLNIPPEDIKNAVELTETQILHEKESYERGRFKPYIYIKSSLSTPTSITIVAFGGVAGCKHIQIPDEIKAMPEDEQLIEIGRFLAFHYKYRNGECLHFGKITGYIYMKSFDNGVVYSIDGTIIGQHNAPINEGEATLFIGKKRIPSSWFQAK
jgi:hypothetical protein